MIEIAGGIILAIFILAFLPWILIYLLGVLGVVVVFTFYAGFAWLVWGAHALAPVGIAFIIGGVLLIMLAYLRREAARWEAKQEMKAEQERRRMHGPRTARAARSRPTGAKARKPFPLAGTRRRG